LCLQLDDGMGGRQVVSGIAKSYEPSELVGKKVMLVANLKPVKIRGVESFGMICATDMADGGVKVMFVDDEVEVGARVR
ncbi:MAG TPA: methionine--tRNA ligase, partial [Clostridiales bacterium]|nr:methionine--tRNA ligase [Clostridiales bacterium]